MLITFLATVFVLRAATWVYTESAVHTPLIQTVRAVPGVARAAWLEGGAVEVALKPSADLMQTYEAVRSRTQAFGQTADPVVEPGNPSLTLTRLANQLRFAIAQGEATGQYVEMDRTILAMARAAGVEASVELGNTHLFITLRQGNHYLFQVLPLNLGGGGHG
jgi:hypothetical protein